MPSNRHYSFYWQVRNQVSTLISIIWIQGEELQCAASTLNQHPSVRPTIMTWEDHRRKILCRWRWRLGVQVSEQMHNNEQCLIISWVLPDRTVYKISIPVSYEGWQIQTTRCSKQLIPLAQSSVNQSPVVSNWPSLKRWGPNGSSFTWIQPPKVAHYSDSK